jgi:hypothetical protein
MCNLTRVCDADLCGVVDGGVDVTGCVVSVPVCVLPVCVDVETVCTDDVLAVCVVVPENQNL